MKINYCLPIIKKTKQEVIETLEKNKNDYEYFEIWLDYIIDCDEVFVQQLIDSLGEKLILLFRRQDMGKIKMNFKQRLVILSLLKNTKTFVDLDMLVNKKELTYLNTANIHASIILSYHNYKETPTKRTLKTIIEKMKAYHPTIIKIATRCQKETDAIRLLEIQQMLVEGNQRHIVLGMGKFGTITRVFGTLWGNEMIFAPQTKSEESAPEQLTQTELEKIFNVLNR